MWVPGKPRLPAEGTGTGQGGGDRMGWWTLQLVSGSGFHPSQASGIRHTECWAPPEDAAAETSTQGT